jgi:hypothetical protein
MLNIFFFHSIQLVQSNVLWSRYVFQYNYMSQVSLIAKWTIRHSNSEWHSHRYPLSSAPCCICPLPTESWLGSLTFQMQDPAPPPRPGAQNMMHRMTSHHPLPSKWTPVCLPYWSTQFLFINYTSVYRASGRNWAKGNYLWSVSESD